MKNMESMLGNMGLPFGKGAKVNGGISKHDEDKY